MHSRVGDIWDQTTDFIAAIGSWIWDTTELVVDIILEFILRSVELAFVVLYLLFQMIGFLRDMCIQALETFGNVIRGIINVVGAIDIEDIEDFSSACIVVLLWFIAAKCILAAFGKSGVYNPMNLLSRFRSNHHVEQDNAWLARNASGARKKERGRKKTH